MKEVSSGDKKCYSPIAAQIGHVVRKEGIGCDPESCFHFRPVIRPPHCVNARTSDGSDVQRDLAKGVFIGPRHWEVVSQLP